MCYSFTKLKLSISSMESCVSALKWKICKVQMKHLFCLLRAIACFEKICCCFCKKMSLKLPDWIGNRKYISLVLSMCKSSTKFKNWCALIIRERGRQPFFYWWWIKLSTQTVYKVTYISLYILQILQMLVSLKNNMSLYLICVITFT